jgi:hypothetical protein
MEYSEPIPILNKPASRLYAAINKASRIDQGTGSTFDAPQQPPRLVGPANHVLELEPMRYEFQTEQTILHSAVTNDRDANWVVVRIAAADGQRRWSSTGPAFLTRDLQQLVSWLRALSDLAPDVPPTPFGSWSTRTDWAVRPFGQTQSLREHRISVAAKVSFERLRPLDQ